MQQKLNQIYNFETFKGVIRFKENVEFKHNFNFSAYLITFQGISRLHIHAVFEVLMMTDRPLSTLSLIPFKSQSFIFCPSDVNKLQESLSSYQSTSQKKHQKLERNFVKNYEILDYKNVDNI